MYLDIDLGLLIVCDNREILRKYLSPALFFVFNVSFISLAQSILLFLITTPAYVMVLAARLGEKMSTADVIFARVLMGLVLVEVFADQQQWSKLFSERQPASSLKFCVMKTSRKPRNYTRRLPKSPTNSNKKTSTADLSSLASGPGVGTLILRQSKRSGLCYTNGAAGPPKCSTIGPSSEPWRISYYSRPRLGLQSLFQPGSTKITKNTSRESASLSRNLFQIFQAISATERQSQR